MNVATTTSAANANMAVASTSGQRSSRGCGTGRSVASGLSADDSKARTAEFTKGVNDALLAAGYPLVAADNTTVAKANHLLDILDRSISGKFSHGVQ